MTKPSAERHPIQSMTGYAVATRDTPAGPITVELRSVNSRFLDLSFRMPDELRPAEPALRDARLVLCACTQQVIANALHIVGVTAPEKM